MIRVYEPSPDYQHFSCEVCREPATKHVIIECRPNEVPASHPLCDKHFEKLHQLTKVA